jgi:hypothetical protein
VVLFLLPLIATVALGVTGALGRDTLYQTTADGSEPTSRGGPFGLFEE